MPRLKTSMNARRRQAGYTLLELLFVAALLAAAAAVIFPSVMAMPSSYRLRRAGDDIRAMLVGVRARAMEDGVPYEFSIDMDAATYRVKKIDPTQAGAAEETSEAPLWNDIDPGSRREFDKGDRIFGTHTLEDGVKFRPCAEADSTLNQPNQNQNQKNNNNNSGKDGTVIRFEPTGIATAMEFFLEDAAYGKARVSIRGLTGAVTVARVNPNAKQDAKGGKAGTERNE